MKSNKAIRWIAKNSLLLATITGVIVGVVAGICARPYNLSQGWKQIIAYPGEIFTRALQMMILPLIISSLVVGSASLNAKMNGRIALRTVAYFVSTSLINAILGVILAVSIHPGQQVVKYDLETSLSTDMQERKNTLLDNFLDLGRNLVPANIFAATFKQTQTVYVETDAGDYIPSVVLKDGTNTLGIITFSLIFGCILGGVGERAKPLIQALSVIDQVIMTMVTSIMWITPFGVASIIAIKLITIEDVSSVTTQLGMFVLTVLIGVLFYQLLIQQLIYLVMIRKNPFKFYASMMEATVTAFSTASTAVALPITFRCMDKQRVDPRISHFVLPIGATVNKDGTALFVAVASIFIAQLNNVDLNLGQLTTIAICSTAVSIASASVPSAALALMFIVLNSVGLDTKDIGLLFAVDWLVDRIRTTNNLLGDCYATAIVEHLSKSQLEEMDFQKSRAVTEENPNGDVPSDADFRV